MRQKMQISTAELSYEVEFGYLVIFKKLICFNCKCYHYVELMIEGLGYPTQMF